ncbi:MAG: VanZ family protein [Ignavibacteria bacterium]
MHFVHPFITKRNHSLISSTTLNIISKLPLLAASIGIFYFSSLPQPPFVLTSFQWQDKILHLSAYFAYGITIALATHVHRSISPKKNMTLIGVIGGLYALSDEFHQSFVPGRTSEVGDIIADWIGVLLAIMLYRFFIKRTA